MRIFSRSGWLIKSAITVLLVAAPVVLTAQPSMSTLTTVHLQIEYAREIPQEDARKVADFLEKDYAFLSAQLGLDLRKRLPVTIYDSPGRFLSESNLRLPWRSGIYWRGVMHLEPVAELVAKRKLEQTLSFELATALLEQTAGRGCPRWLREAFAVYHSGVLSDLTPPIGTRIRSFSDLDQDLQLYPDPPRRDDVHFLLGETMRFFIQKYGEQKTFSLYGAFDGMSTAEEVLSRTFGQEFPLIERTWANYIASQTERFKKRE